MPETWPDYLVLSKLHQGMVIKRLFDKCRQSLHVAELKMACTTTLSAAGKPDGCANPVCRPMQLTGFPAFLSSLCHSLPCHDRVFALANAIAYAWL